MNKTYISTFVNTFSYYELLDSGCSIEKIDSLFIDGSLQVKLHNIFCGNKVKRASFDFSSIAHDFFCFVSEHQFSIAIIGARDEEISSAVKNLNGKYPGLRISYFHNGYFNDENEKEEVCNVLENMAINIVILGMGTPEQENFALYLKENEIPLHVFTCGGFITQTASNIDYYKPAAKKYFRWLQRAIEYKHIRKRLLFDYPVNILRYIFDHCIINIFFRKI